MFNEHFNDTIILMERITIIFCYHSIRLYSQSHHVTSLPYYNNIVIKLPVAIASPLVETMTISIFSSMSLSYRSNPQCKIFAP